MQMIWFYLSVFSALFIFMLDYGLGLPADEKVSYGSFLFKYSFWHARRALGRLIIPMAEQYREQLSNATDALQKHRIKREYQEIVFTQGRELFTWQKAFGMCPYCTHFWFTVIIFSVNIFYYPVNIITFIAFLLSHAILRFLKRWI